MSLFNRLHTNSYWRPTATVTYLYRLDILVENNNFYIKRFGDHVGISTDSIQHA